MDESEHGPHLPLQPRQGALYSPDWVVIPCPKDNGMHDAQMHTCNNVNQKSDKCYSTNRDNLRRLKLHGQNVPKTASPWHCEKIVVLGDPKTQQPKIPQKVINWSIFIYFQENRLPGKIIYFSKNALRFSQNRDFLFPLPLMLSYENTHELAILSKTSF